MHNLSDSEDFIVQKTFAIVGASNDRNKYGNIVYRNLRTKGYTVYAVNPGATTVEGDPCYPDLAALPGPVDGIVLVVPPRETEKVVREASKLGIPRVWMQEGAESEDAIEFSVAHGMKTIYDQCVMVASNYRSLIQKKE